MKKVSVIIPCYQCKQVIDRALNAILRQTMNLADIEIILVDDASPDDSFVYLQEWESRYPDTILLVHCGENGGQAVARNIGLEYATGEYVAFLDQDDWTHPEMYQNMYETAVKYRCDMVSAFHRMVFSVSEAENENNEMGRRQPKSQDAFYIAETEEQRRTLLLRGVGTLGGNTVWDKLFLRTFLKKNHIQFPQKSWIYEDFYFMVLVSFYVHRFYIMQCNYYYWYINKNGTFFHRDKAYHLDKLQVCEELYRESQKRAIYEKYREEVEVRFLLDYYIDGMHIMFTKFNQLPVKKYYEMKQTVLAYIPQIKENSYLQNSVVRTYDLGLKEGSWRHKFLETLFYDITPEELSKLAKQYWESVQGNYIVVE
ncbi:MAG: glycosyltransferase family 2 protein [Clostridiaceae bacterium]|nr:glycosyltransferase family 2 protein [Clostridiaceae bacterium]